MRVLAAVLFLLTLIAVAQASVSPEPFLDRAKEAAENGRLSEALSLYKKIQQSGSDSAALSFNIGVIALELRDYGPAIHELRKAARSYPLKSRYLFELAQARTLSGSSAEFTPFIDLHISAGLVRLIALLSILLLALVWRTQWRTLFAALILLPLSLLGAAEYSLFRYHLTEPEVIVQHDKTEAYASPDSGAQAVEVVAAGAELKIVGDHEGWFQVELPSGRKGWMKDTAGAVDPEL